MSEPSWCSSSSWRLAESEELLTSDPERDLLELGRSELRKARAAHESGHDLALNLRNAVDDPNERYAVAAAVYAAIIDGGPETRPGAARRHEGASAALGAAAGTAGLSSDLYRAARIGRDVHAIERSVETGNTAYVERRIKNRIVGRALARAGVWRRLWR